MISIDARDIRQCTAFTMPFNAYSFHTTRATTGFGFGAFDTRARYILCDALRDAARRGTAFRLEDSTIDGRFYIRFELAGFNSISLYEGTDSIHCSLARFFCIFAFFASGSAQTDDIGNCASTLDQALSGSAECKHFDRFLDRMLACFGVTIRIIDRFFNIHGPNEIP